MYEKVSSVNSSKGKHCKRSHKSDDEDVEGHEGSLSGDSEQDEVSAKSGGAETETENESMTLSLVMLRVLTVHCL